MQETTTAEDSTNKPKRKSVALEPSEKQLLKKFIKQHNTLTEAAEALGVSRQVLDRINLVGSGKPDNISIIKSKINTAA